MEIHNLKNLLDSNRASQLLTMRKQGEIEETYNKELNYLKERMTELQRTTQQQLDPLNAEMERLRIEEMGIDNAIKEELEKAIPDIKDELNEKNAVMEASSEKPKK